MINKQSILILAIQQEKESLSIIVIKHVILHICRNQDILFSPSAMDETEGIREEDELD